VSVEDVGRALLHFARLAASHAQWGVSFMRENSTVLHQRLHRDRRGTGFGARTLCR